MDKTFFAALAAISFLLNIVWEFLHVPLYGGYENLSPYLPLSVWAALADVLYVLFAVLFVSLLRWDTTWLRHVRLHDLIGLALLGFLIAIFVEYKAMAFEKWYYLETMPIVPFTKAGLSPILQMTLLLPLSVYLAHYTKNLLAHKT